jgi:hypothetical protein
MLKSHDFAIGKEWNLGLGCRELTGDEVLGFGMWCS